MLGDSLGVSVGMVLINTCTPSHSLNSISPILHGYQALVEHDLQSQYTIQRIWADHTLHFLLWCSQMLSSLDFRNFTVNVFLSATFPAPQCPLPLPWMLKCSFKV